MTSAAAKFRRTAVRFWEKRRIAYNLALLPAAAFGYIPRVSICSSVGDTPVVTDRVVISVFAGYAIAANICYTFAYALEFFFGFGDEASRWNISGRRIAFFTGTALSLMLAYFAAVGVALAQFPDILTR